MAAVRPSTEAEVVGDKGTFDYLRTTKLYIFNNKKREPLIIRSQKMCFFFGFDLYLLDDHYLGKN